MHVYYGPPYSHQPMGQPTMMQNPLEQLSQTINFYKDLEKGLKEAAKNKDDDDKKKKKPSNWDAAERFIWITLAMPVVGTLQGLFILWMFASASQMIK